MKKTVTELVDDLDGTPAVFTRWLALDGKAVRLDLSQKNSALLDAAVEQFLAAGTPDRGSKTPRARGASLARARATTIRGWARDNGYELKTRGRIPAEVLQAYADYVAAGARTNG